MRNGLLMDNRFDERAEILAGQFNKIYAGWEGRKIHDFGFGRIKYQFKYLSG
jgi:hypothetical protein